MKLSVVIPLYNKEKYIKRAITSVVLQDACIREIIVIDDGSTDQGVARAKEILDPRVRIIAQDNQGECAARNRGIEESQGELIAFLDADDEWKPNFLKRIQTLIINFPDCGAYATSAQIIRPEGTISYPDLGSLPPEPWIGIIPNFFEVFQHGYPFNASSIIIPRKVLFDVGLFPVGVKISGDVDCWVRIAMKYPIAFSSSRDVIYHQEASNRVGTVYKPMQQLIYIDTIRQAIKENRLPIDLQPAALEFIAVKQIAVASGNVMAGNLFLARELLGSCQTTKKYKRSWLWWRMWASLPSGWPLKLLKLKEFFLDSRLF